MKGFRLCQFGRVHLQRCRKDGPRGSSIKHLLGLNSHSCFQAMIEGISSHNYLSSWNVTVKYFLRGRDSCQTVSTLEANRLGPNWLLFMSYYGIWILHKCAFFLWSQTCRQSVNLRRVCYLAVFIVFSRPHLTNNATYVWEPCIILLGQGFFFSNFFLLTPRSTLT